ncbi:MAG TPA: GGDEF domain-containing protein [Anaeromyxobacter sp.]
MGEDATRVRPPGGGAPGAGEASLVFVEGGTLLGVRVALGGEVVLGRDPGCTVPLPADDVSRRHARVVAQDGGHEVVDLGSTNGTWVNGARVERHRLAPGDRIRVGAYVAAYVAAGDLEGRHLEELARLAREDALTGLPNRRAFDEALAREVARAERSGAPLAAVAIDVDRFKRVNDEHGHAAGDAVLAAVAGRAASALRAGDLLARTGGEEFAALLPGADLAAAAEAAERIRAAVAAADVEAGGVALPVTVSLGCAAREAGETGPALLARADARLYAAKAGGRNRVEI